MIFLGDRAPQTEEMSACRIYRRYAIKVAVLITGSGPLLIERRKPHRSHLRTSYFEACPSGKSCPLSLFGALRILQKRDTSLIEMASSASVSARGSEFNDFLRAPIGQDGNDMPLSVLSSRRELNVDPRHEGAELARSSGVTATQRLASLIAARLDWPTMRLDPTAIATRLMPLLPDSRRKYLSGTAECVSDTTQSD